MTRCHRCNADTHGEYWMRNARPHCYRCKRDIDARANAQRDQRESRPSCLLAQVWK